jgi:hypothetical protein
MQSLREACSKVGKSIVTRFHGILSPTAARKTSIPSPQELALMPVDTHNPANENSPGLDVSYRELYEVLDAYLATYEVNVALTLQNIWALAKTTTSAAVRDESRARLVTIKATQDAHLAILKANLARIKVRVLTNVSTSSDAVTDKVHARLAMTWESRLATIEATQALIFQTIQAFEKSMLDDLLARDLSTTARNTREVLITSLDIEISDKVYDLIRTFAADRLQISIYANERTLEPFKTLHDRLGEVESFYTRILVHFKQYSEAPENVRMMAMSLEFDTFVDYYSSGLQFINDLLKITQDMDTLKKDFMTARLSQSYYGLCLDLRVDISRFLSPGYHNGASFLNDKEAMEYLMEYPERCSDVEYLEMVTRFGPYPERCDHRGMLTEIAATGNLKALQWALKKGLPWEESIGWNAARYGHIHILQFMQSIGHVLDEQCCHMAARYAQLETLKWLHEHGCPWNEKTCISAVREDQFDILRWLRDQGCPWDGETTIGAAISGRLDILEWAWLHGCPMNTTDIIFNAIDYWQWSVLRWGMERGRWTLDNILIFFIVWEDYLHHLHTLKEEGFLFDATSCALAARYDSLTVLQCLHEEAVPWDETTCEAAARAGAFELLVWAREQGCPWDRRTCIAAAENQHWLILSWARENGCPHCLEDILSYLPD